MRPPCLHFCRLLLLLASLSTSWAEPPHSWRDTVSASWNAAYRNAGKIHQSMVRSRLLQENKLIEPFIRSRTPIDPDPSPWASSVRLEASGEYCRAKNLNFETALPGIWDSEQIVFAGALPGDRETEPWVILYRTVKSWERDIPLRMNLLTLYPPGQRPPLRTDDEKAYGRVKIHSIAPKGLSNRSTVWRAKSERGGRDIAFEVLEQWRPLADDDWFTQIVARFCIRHGRIERLWQEEYSLHRVNFVYDLAFTPVRKGPPRVQLAEGR